jgi:uncharacterized protein
MTKFNQTERTRVRRHADRGVYDATQVHRILDEGYICHVGFVVDAQPFVIPTAYGRAGDRMYIHGAAASRMLRSLEPGIDVCVTVTLVDGFVLARSAFNHSLNYRSVVIFGTAQLVSEPGEKKEALRCLTNHLVPGRWEEVRQPSAKEMQATTVLAIPINEASAKIRSGPPVDNKDDYPLAVWAGVVPVRTQPGEPVPDAHVLPGTDVVDTRRFKRLVD